MEYKPQHTKHQTALVELFQSVFSAAEGEQEGRQLARLVARLAEKLDHPNRFAFAAYQAKKLRGAIFFTPLSISQPYSIYMLSPVAIHTDYQGQGIGQALIHYGLAQMRQHAVDAVVTYGDPAYYTKTGFVPAYDFIQPPFALSMPEGWLYRKLSARALPATNEIPACVEAFNHAHYW